MVMCLLKLLNNMIKFKIFDNLEDLNTFDKSQRVLVINIETVKTSDRERIKLWYREVPALKKKTNE
jgi:hypothetical protein